MRTLPVLISALALFAFEAGVAQNRAFCDTKVVPDDVGISFPSEFVSFKPTSAGAKMSMQSWLIYFRQVPDLKAKAEGVVTIYLSNDSIPDSGDTLIAVKSAKVKTTWPKVLKHKFNLTQADKGKYIVGVLSDCPQDEYAANNVVSRQILANDF